MRSGLPTRRSGTEPASDGARDPQHDDTHNDRPWHVVVTRSSKTSIVGCAKETPCRTCRASRAIPKHPTASRGDEYGNARGGLRTPWLDVPTARYAPRCTCSPVTGSMTPLSDDELRARYADRARSSAPGSGRSTRWSRTAGCSRPMPSHCARTCRAEAAAAAWTAAPSSGSRPPTNPTTGACPSCRGSRAGAASSSAGAGSAPRARRWS